MQILRLPPPFLLIPPLLPSHPGPEKRARLPGSWQRREEKRREEKRREEKRREERSNE
jgi:hypothetical protein